MTLFNSDGQSIGKLDGPFFTRPIPADMDIYVEIDSNGTFSSYSLTVTPLVDGGQDIDSATVLPVNTTLVDATDSDDSDEWFSIAAQPFVPYLVDANIADLAIFDAEGNELPPGPVAGFRSSTGLLFDSETQLYLRVTPIPFEDVFRVSFEEIIDDHGNDMASASDYPAEFGVGIEADLTPGDVDWFKFQPEFGKTYWARAHYGTVLSLWSQAGEQITEGFHGHMSWTAATEDVVFVRISSPDQFTATSLAIEGR